MTVKDVLQTAKATISQEQYWIQDALALDENGYEVCPINENACQWCALGAIESLGWTRHNIELYRSTIKALALTIEPTVNLNEHAEVIANFNDDSYTTYQDVIETFDKAIQEAE